MLSIFLCVVWITLWCVLKIIIILKLFFLFRIVNSELTYFKGALQSLESVDAFGSSLFDVWTVNR